MKYKVDMQNVGRLKACETKIFDRPPTYEDLLAMVRRHLLSSEIDFVVMEETDSKETGKVRVGGWRSAGDFSIEKQPEGGGYD